MKSMKIIMATLFVLIIGVSNVWAQEKLEMENLTKVQNELLQAQRELIRANREAIKASLSEEQLAILQNQTLSKKERQKMLVTSFTIEQQALVAENKTGVQELKEQFRASLTEEQREHIRDRMKTRRGENRNELRESVKEKRKQKSKGGH